MSQMLLKVKYNKTTENGESENANDRSNSDASTEDREFVMGYEGGPRAASSVCPLLHYHNELLLRQWSFFPRDQLVNSLVYISVALI